jgi:hypothetical protein
MDGVLNSEGGFWEAVGAQRRDDDADRSHVFFAGEKRSKRSCSFLRWGQTLLIAASLTLLKQTMSGDDAAVRRNFLPLQVTIAAIV